MPNDLAGPNIDRVREALRREEERPEPPRRDDDAEPQRRREARRDRLEPDDD